MAAYVPGSDLTNAVLIMFLCTLQWFSCLNSVLNITFTHKSPRVRRPEYLRTVHLKNYTVEGARTKYCWADWNFAFVISVRSPTFNG